MFGLFRKRQHSVIGADIDNLYASMLELSSEGDTFVLKACEIGALPEKNMNSQEQTTTNMLDFEAQGSSLAKLLKKGKFSSKNVISAVAASSVITKHLVMDASLNDEEMESQVVLEAEQVIPYPIEEVALDFDILGEHAGDEEKVDVLLVACRKQTVDDRESVLMIAGLSPRVIEVVNYAMERAYPLIQSRLSLPEKECNVALVHVGDLFTTLNVLKDGKSIYVRSCPFGVRQMVELLCQKSQCTLQEALEKCLQADLFNSEEDLVSEYSFQAARHINRLLEQYYSAEHASLVDHIVLSGGLAAIEEVRKKMATLANVQCSTANPFSDMKFASSVNKEQLSQCAPAFFVACGLAMRRDL